MARPHPVEVGEGAPPGIVAQGRTRSGTRSVGASKRMDSRKVAFLTPLYFDERSYLGGGERYPLNLAKGVVAGSNGRFAVELISFGQKSLRRVLAPGVGLRVLKIAGRPRHPLDVV